MADIRTVVVTGASSSLGIGFGILQAAANRGFQVVGCGSRPSDRLTEDLQAFYRGEYAKYFQVDVTDSGAVQRFAADVSSAFPELGPMLVVANAGQAARGSMDAIRKMEAINVGGALHTLHAFGPLVDQDKASRFVGVSSIVAVERELFAVQGDTDYLRTKAAIQALFARRKQSWVLAPGAFLTDMTSGEQVFGFIFVRAAQNAAHPHGDPEIKAALALVAGVEIEALGETPAAVIRSVVGAELQRDAKWILVNRALSRDPQFTTSSTVVVVGALSREPAASKVLQALARTGIVCSADIIGEPVLETWLSGQDPQDGVLRVYGAGDPKDWNWTPIVRSLQKLPAVTG